MKTKSDAALYISSALSAGLLISASGYSMHAHGSDFQSVFALAASLCAIVTFAFAILNLRQSRLSLIQAESDRQRFASLVQNSADVIAIASLDRQLEYMNPAARKILGVDPTESVKNMPTPQFYSAATNEQMRNVVFPSIREKGFWSGEIQHVNRKTLETIPVLMNIFAMKDVETGEPNGIACVSRDIRDLKRLEKDLDRFFNVSLDMMAIANTKGYFLRLNPAFSEILGYTAEELCSRPAVDFVHPDDIERTMEQLRNQADGRPVLSFENRYRTKSGDYRWFSWKSFPDGDLTYGAARDITEEKKQQELLQKLGIDAIAASRAKSEFLANMSHEIRTPINGVVGMTTLLLDSELTPEQLEFAENIKTSAQSLLTVVNDILDFSKVEAGKLDIECVDFNLGHLVEDMTKTMSWATANKSLPLLVNCDPAFSTMLRGDPGRIRQVLTNLVGNAIKFTSQGQINIDVRRQSTLAGDVKKSVFRFTVTDTGIGIAKQAQSKLFQPFGQADASTNRRYGGSGLGLSICRSLVNLMDGEIGFESEEGRGSVFWFSLPLAHSTLPEFGASEHQTVVRATAFPGAQVLVAEDNIINQKILLSMLKKLGIQAQAVANGSEVLSILRDRDFDLILMDCQMPELDGYETTRLVRRSSSLPFTGIPIVAMTANALKGDKEKCLEAGMDDYATKPIALDALAKVVEKWLAISAAKKRSA